MNIGKNLSAARRKSGLSQEEVAEKLGVSRQTVSKWELNESIPDILECKKLSKLYNKTIDELVDIDDDIGEIVSVIEKTDDKVYEKVDWTKVWSKKYPILALYQREVDVRKYANKLRELLEEMKGAYGYSELDAVLVLKDILAKEMRKK